MGTIISLLVGFVTGVVVGSFITYIKTKPSIDTLNKVYDNLRPDWSCDDCGHDTVCSNKKDCKHFKKLNNG